MLAQIDLLYQVVVVQHLQQMSDSLTLGFRERISALHFSGFKINLPAKMFKLRACLHGGGGPQAGEVKCGVSPDLSCKRDQNKMRDYMDGWVNLPKRVTSPTWGAPPPYKQALK